MFYDLSIPYSPTDVTLPSTLAFAAELGYNIIALNISLSGTLPAEIRCQIPANISSPSPRLQILRRVTLTLTTAHPNSRLTQLGQQYDVLALRPIDERTLQLACSSLDCDIISLDLSQRLGYFFKYKMLSEAIKAGKRIEICYAQGIMGDAQARRNVISNATQLIRATRGRGILISSESAVGAAGLRGPWDVVNLAAVWGLGQERGVEAIGKEARSVVVQAQLKRTGYRGVVDVVEGGEKPAVVEVVEKVKEKKKNGDKAQKNGGQKRKAEDEGVTNGEQPLSNRQRKKLAHEAKVLAAKENAGDISISAGNGNGGAG
ncbi:related to ribonuclease P complex subunit Pop2 [Ramularia collo-cygni]|uniref:Related to ribonuclease P complex subunit Pop2 n=1 Tax=Ramularia collo-cygni TaxID=112498 RepID=A0A2D3UQI6_9PEZI|nr:related to ribonuclease P complex subunit Pop2 [Ramularia collo-cygni]CZT19162.1 related to ribonuclease P complex subunit Pop2 [Ramularia collo-cygni]